MPKRVFDLAGQQFGRLKVVNSVYVKGAGTVWVCKCECGNEIFARAGNLTRGNTKSCGCLRKRTKPISHPKPPRRGDTKLSWELMINRCHNRKSEKWKDYGGRGITVCPQWLDYNTFLADMGERPLGTTLDRIDNDGNYEPGNCRWATAKQQANNRRDNVRLQAFGREQTLRQWAEEYKLPVSTFAGRLQKGMEVEGALLLPLWGNLSSHEMKQKFYRNRKSNFIIEAFGQRKPLIAWAEEYGINAITLSARIRRRGCSPEEALTTPIIPRGERHKGMKL